MRVDTVQPSEYQMKAFILRLRVWNRINANILDRTKIKEDIMLINIAHSKENA